MNSSELIKASVYNHFVAQAELTPSVEALTAPERSPLSYARLRSELDTVRESMNAFGLGRNDRVIIVLDNGPEMAVAFMALAACVTAVPLNPAYRADEFEFYLSRINAKALVVSTEDQTAIKELGYRLGLRIIELVPRRDAEAAVALFRVPQEGIAAHRAHQGDSDVHR